MRNLFSRRRQRRRARRGGTALFWLAAGSVVLPLSLLLFAWFIVIPWPRGLETGAVDRTALMEQRIEEARAAGEALQARQDWLSLDEISPNLVRAVIVAEDYRFLEHAGVDWVSLAEEVGWEGGDTFSWRISEDRAALYQALDYAWHNHEQLRGRSTITQQLAKNLYFGTERTLHRKAMELIVAQRLERRLDKDRILEIYLNVAEWGPGIFGAEAAAREYFGRSAATLTLSQSAALAATLPHPLTSNPDRAPGRMEWRRSVILERLDPTPEATPPVVRSSLRDPETQPVPPEARTPQVLEEPPERSRR